VAKLTDKAALVTGGSRGIGAAIAKRLIPPIALTARRLPLPKPSDREKLLDAGSRSFSTKFHPRA
jgi:NAD(P)-dependent dehydrogenase (short-subunit alcohol dehydrogenase family)